MQKTVPVFMLLIFLSGCGMKPPFQSSTIDQNFVGADAAPDQIKLMMTAGVFQSVPLTSVIAVDVSLEALTGPKPVAVNKHYVGANAQKLIKPLSLNSPSLAEPSACFAEGVMTLYFNAAQTNGLTSRQFYLQNSCTLEDQAFPRVVYHSSVAFDQNWLSSAQDSPN
jgi:hypothetical protein